MFNAVQIKKVPPGKRDIGIGQGIDVLSHQAPYKPILSANYQDGNTLAKTKIAHKWLEKGYISVPNSETYYDLLALYWRGCYAYHIPLIKVITEKHRVVVLTDPISSELPVIGEELTFIFNDLLQEYPGYCAANLFGFSLACGSNIEKLAKRIVNVFEMLIPSGRVRHER